MKTLIVYYSFTSNNEKLAKYLQQQLHCDIVRIETVNKRNQLSIMLDLLFSRKPDIKAVPYYLLDYDHIIFLAPIWAGKVAMPLKTFLLNEKANIRQYSFITLCGGGSANQKQNIENELLGLVGKIPMKVIEFAISDLLPADKNTRENISSYRIDSSQFVQFDKTITELTKKFAEPVIA